MRHLQFPHRVPQHNDQLQQLALEALEHDFVEESSLFPLQPYHSPNSPQQSSSPNSSTRNASNIKSFAASTQFRSYENVNNKLRKQRQQLMHHLQQHQTGNSSVHVNNSNAEQSAQAESLHPHPPHHEHIEPQEANTHRATSTSSLSASSTSSYTTSTSCTTSTVNNNTPPSTYSSSKTETSAYSPTLITITHTSASPVTPKYNNKKPISFPYSNVSKDGPHTDLTMHELLFTPQHTIESMFGSKLGVQADKQAEQQQQQQQQQSRNKNHNSYEYQDEEGAGTKQEPNTSVDLMNTSDLQVQAEDTLQYNGGNDDVFDTVISSNVNTPIAVSKLPRHHDETPMTSSLSDLKQLDTLLDQFSSSSSSAYTASPTVKYPSSVGGTGARQAHSSIHSLQQQIFENLKHHQQQEEATSENLKLEDLKKPVQPSQLRTSIASPRRRNSNSSDLARVVAAGIHSRRSSSTGELNSPTSAPVQALIQQFPISTTRSRRNSSSSRIGELSEDDEVLSPTKRINNVMKHLSPLTKGNNSSLISNSSHRAMMNKHEKEQQLIEEKRYQVFEHLAKNYKRLKSAHKRALINNVNVARLREVDDRILQLKLQRFETNAIAEKTSKTSRPASASATSSSSSGSTSPHLKPGGVNTSPKQAKSGSSEAGVSMQKLFEAGMTNLPPLQVFKLDCHDVISDTYIVKKLHDDQHDHFASSMDQKFKEFSPYSPRAKISSMAAAAAAVKPHSPSSAKHVKTKSSDSNITDNSNHSNTTTVAHNVATTDGTNIVVEFQKILLKTDESNKRETSPPRHNRNETHVSISGLSPRRSPRNNRRAKVTDLNGAVPAHGAYLTP